MQGSDINSVQTCVQGQEAGHDLLCEQQTIGQLSEPAGCALWHTVERKKKKDFYEGLRLGFLHILKSLKIVFNHNFGTCQGNIMN